MKRYIQLFEQFVSDLNEGGNAIDTSRPMSQKEVKDVYDYVKSKIFPLVGLEGDDVDAAPIGSYGKKMPDATSGDLDIAVSVDKIAGVNSLPIDPDAVLDFMDSKLKAAGYSTSVQKGFKQISVGVAIPGTSDTAQIDLMLSTSLEWSKFMYYSPDFTKAESKYKGAYRNLLLMAIINYSKREAAKLTDAGEVEEIDTYVLQLDRGVQAVRKSFMGKRGNIVKQTTTLHEFDKFISNTPDVVVKLAWGENTKVADTMTFENCWALTTSGAFPHKDKLQEILKAFKAYLMGAKLPMPTEAAEAYPSIFG
jgi:hypothetical protein